MNDNYKYIFDSDGLYGGSQNLPKQDPIRYFDILKKYNKNCTYEQLVEKLTLLSTEGCGYVALVNSIFLRFYGQEEQFGDVFGFSMYDADGKLNFNDLLVDFYFATDNHNRFLGFDYYDSKEDKNYEKGYGTTLETSKWRFEQYMKKHGIRVKLELIKPRLYNIEEQLLKGPITVSVNPTCLYDVEGNLIHDAKGGHTMSVVGVSNKGYVKVSSWGREYYVKMGSYSKYEYYQQVLFLD